MGRRRKGDSDELLKQRITESIGELFFNKGTALTMDELSKSFQVSKKTLYRLFPTKEEMVLEVARTFTRKITRFMEKTREKMEREGPDSFIPMLKKVVARMGSFVLSFPLEAQYGLEKGSPLLYGRISNIRRDVLMSAFGGTLQKGKDLGVIRPDVDTELAAFLYAVMVEQIYVHGGLGPSRAPYDVYITAVKIIFSGVLQSDKRLEFDASDLPRLRADNLWHYLDSDDDAEAGVH